MTSLLSVLTGEIESRVELTAVMASQEFEFFLPKAEMPSRAPLDLSYSTLKTREPVCPHGHLPIVGQMESVLSFP